MATLKSLTQAHKEENMTDTSKMTPEEKIAFAQSLMEEAKADGQKMFDDTINFLNEKLQKMGRSKLDAMSGLYLLMNPEEQKSFVTKFKEVTGSAKPKQRAAKGTAPKTEKAFVRGTTYKDPAGVGKEWTAGGLGAKPKWLKALVDNLPAEEQKKKYEELAVK